MIDYAACKTESAKYRELTAPYCVGCGLDIASQGDPVVPWAWSLELPQKAFGEYNGGGAGIPAHGPIQLRGYASDLPVENASLDFVYCSHLLEDYDKWLEILREWVRVLKPGGMLIILVPEKTLWDKAIAAGQPPNLWHKHEAQVGELTSYAPLIGVEVIEDRLTNLFPGDYTILFRARKL